MEKFKKNWEIQQNWQLLFPFLGLLGLGYSSYKLTKAFLSDFHFVVAILAAIPVFYALYKVLSVALDLRHTPFWGWIQDLSAKDPTSILNLFGSRSTELEVQLQEVIRALCIPLDCNQFSEKFVEFLFD